MRIKEIKNEFERKYKENSFRSIIDIALFKKLDMTHLMIFITWFVLSTIIVAVPFFSNKVNFKVKDIAPFSLFSPVDVEFSTKQDLLDTEKLREERVADVKDVYDIDKNITEKAKSKVAEFFKSIENLRKKDISEAERIKIKKGLPYSLSQKNLGNLIGTDKNVLVLIENLIVQKLDQIMSAGVEDRDSLEIRVLINTEVSRMNLHIRYKEIIKEILYQAVENNKTFNLIATNLKKSQIRAGVTPHKTRFVKNQPIIYKGDEITEQHIEILTKMGMYGSLFNPVKIFSIAILNFVIIFMFVGYILRFRKGFVDNKNLLILIVFFSVLLLLLARFLVNLEPLFVPIIAIAFLFTIILPDLITVLFLMLRLSLLITMIYKFDFYYFSILLFSSFMAVYFSRFIVERNDITKAGFNTAIGSVILFWAVSSASGRFVLESVPITTLKLMGTSLFSAMFVLGVLPYIEEFFNVVTSIKLLELANPNNPLFKRLLIEAPGTYHHSIMVANLSEAAIEATSGDPLLARVAAYYHDIGKIGRPYFFIENQGGLGNPHDKINVNLSVLIILSHVKDGVEVARKYRLPKVIIDIIQQHHGTDIMSFFYRSFLEQHLQQEDDEKLNLTESDFRYPGPKPQTKEAAAIMMADSCEAAIRSLEKAGPTKVQNTIEKIIKDKFNSGQLDECDFTFKDLTKIKIAFMKRLEGSFHSRIEYPDEVVAKEKEKE